MAELLAKWLNDDIKLSKVSKNTKLFLFYLISFLF